MLAILALGEVEHLLLHLVNLVIDDSLREVRLDRLG